jgi:hypothetical protein
LEIVLLIGAAPYRLDRHGAEYLLKWIRQSCRDKSGQPLDEMAAACLLLGEVLEDDLARGESPEPVELGQSQVEGLLAYVLRDYLVQGDAELTALYYALRRYRGDPV